MELQTLAKTKNTNKRPLSKIADMDVDGESSSKKMKVDKGKDVIGLER